MKRSLIDTMFMSEKRKNMLLLLRNGPLSMDEILDILDVSRHAMLPQVKILVENELVIKERDECRLSRIGEVVVEDMVPLLGTLTVLEESFQYWIEHDLSPIPPHLLKRIRELGYCKVVEPDLNDMFELNRELIDKSLDSDFVMGATAFLHPAFPSFVLNLVRKNIDVSIIMTEEAFEKHKVDYKEELEVFLGNNKGKLFIYPENMLFVSLFVTDSFLMMCLFDRNGKYDRKDLVFCSAEAQHWGRELFEYYLSRSRTVLEL